MKSTMANMTYDQEKELVSLVAWLQTFPEFGLFLYDGKESPEDVQRLHSSLCTIEAAR